MRHPPGLKHCSLWAERPSRGVLGTVGQVAASQAPPRGCATPTVEITKNVSRLCPLLGAQRCPQVRIAPTAPARLMGSAVPHAPSPVVRGLGHLPAVVGGVVDHAP